MSEMTIEERIAALGRAVGIASEQMVPFEWREELAKRGYQGQRCGWYPEKPKRRRKART